jgi:hypothetical protein
MHTLLHIAIIWATLLALVVNPKSAEQVAQDIRDDGF